MLGGVNEFSRRNEFVEFFEGLHVFLEAEMTELCCLKEKQTDEIADVFDEQQGARNCY